MTSPSVASNRPDFREKKTIYNQEEEEEEEAKVKKIEEL